MPRFPQVIVVTEETPDNGPPWLEVHSAGVDDVDTDGTYVAVYHLARVGTVQIKKSFRDVQKPAPDSPKRRRRKT